MDIAYIQISITKSICNFRNTVKLQAPSLVTLYHAIFQQCILFILRPLFSHQFMTPIMTTLFSAFGNSFSLIIVKLMMGYVPKTVLLLLTLWKFSSSYFLHLETFYTCGRFSKGPDFGPKKLLMAVLLHYLRNIISERQISFCYFYFTKVLQISKL